jgi:hypothetical protein
MRRLVWIISLLTLIAPLGARNAQAQGFVPRGANAALATRDYIINRPTVSPYLNLLRTESPISAPNYQTLVRPALEHRQEIQRQESAIRQLQSRVVNMQGQMAARNRRQQEGFATGHPQRFMTYLHYYPMFNRR